MNYQEYLQSPQWKRLRLKVLRRDHFRCRSCGRKAWQVHHGSYSRAVMEGRDWTQLFAICGRCHVAATFTVTGAKRGKQDREQLAADLNRAEPKAKKPRKPKTKRQPMTMDEIRALSKQYAEGDFS